MMRVLVVGNPDIESDALPLRILPKLLERFPGASFDVLDPNEEWNISGDVTLLDTVQGIQDVHLFEDLRVFRPAPTVTLHDYDALAQMQYLQKLGAVTNIKIIGVPPMMSEEQALEGVSALIRSTQR